ncbi:hypothetical protein HYDPIDRAFT_102069 [Hydnomerulius pinastri MD-312]|uniref:Ribosomal protein/NADH dehydrogenase domain-containing protein n=1 Tax=Hydnomerulius pinastri MD-312 TaxID=994086 RepID=A0A0C9W834_9AGAM|nr:hypothetical protein HYDPIDRAFT_102069 [Hydnomerulius pinastri MD-312]
MPRRRGKFIPPPSELSRVLEHLNTGPRLALNGLRRISLTLAARNDHMGARHFVKEELPRIRWANPLLDIEVNKVQKKREDVLKPEAQLEFQDGTKSTIDMSNKWSTTIAKELMDLAGGDPWKAYKAATLAAGQPLLPGEEKERLASLAKSRKTNNASKNQPQSQQGSNEELEAKVREMLNAPDRPKTGARAMLP